MSKQQPREFWIQKGSPDMIADSFQESEGFCNGHRAKLPVIHTVEFAAFTDLQAKCAELEAEVDRLRAALGYYANRNYMQAKNRFDHDGDIEDVDRGKTARQALELKGEK